MRPSPEIRNIILGWLHDMSTTGQQEAAVALYSRSEHATGIGTDPNEFWMGGETIRAIMRTQLQEVGPGRFDAVTIHAFEDGGVAWAAVDSIVSIGNLQQPVRMSIVLHREDARWTIAHSHFSVPQSNIDLLGLELTTTIDDIAESIERERPDLNDSASPEGTVTIVFTDMESSTDINERVGDDRFIPVLRRHNEIFDSETRTHGGTVVKSAGDGFMLAFPSARRAVDCAIAIQREIEQLDTPDIPVRVRMGLHTGEPTRMEDDFYGRDVAYAARIGSAAVGRQILVSALVKELCSGAGSYSFDEPRSFELKGFDGPQAVYAVNWSA